MMKSYINVVKHVLLFVLAILIIVCVIQNVNVSFSKKKYIEKLDTSPPEQKNIFDGVTKFENIDDREGYDICLEKCKGNCVEYGLHGTSYCFE